jgi:hypothetical protein
MENDICKCGHEKKFHYIEYWYGGGSDNICCRDGKIYHLCNFKFDNLKYLEQLYENNHSGK